MPIPGNPAARRLRQWAALLAYPEGEALAAVRELRTVADWPSSAALAELAALPLERWQAEYTRLFINGYPTTPCPPFATAHWGPGVAEELQALYHRAGLHAPPEWADYLGTLLDCAAYLLEVAPQAAVLAELRDDYLAVWLPRFAAALQTHAALQLYRELGAVLGEVPAELA